MRSARDAAAGHISPLTSARVTADGKTYGDRKEAKDGNVARGPGGVTLAGTCRVAPLRGGTTFTLLTALTPQDNWARRLFHFSQQN